MTTDDMPADAGDVEALAEVVGHVLSEYLDDAAPLNERRYVVAARHVLSVDGSPGMTAYFAARDAAQRAEWERQAATIPEPDNHHNAAYCPYCSPQIRERIEKARTHAREAAQAVLNAVEQLHVPFINDHDGHIARDTYETCRHDHETWPCPTVLTARAAAAKYGAGTCSTCGGLFDSPPCSLNREIRWSGHTVSAGTAGGSDA